MTRGPCGWMARSQRAQGQRSSSPGGLEVEKGLWSRWGMVWGLMALSYHRPRQPTLPSHVPLRLLCMADHLQPLRHVFSVSKRLAAPEPLGHLAKNQWLATHSISMAFSFQSKHRLGGDLILEKHNSCCPTSGQGTSCCSGTQALVAPAPQTSTHSQQSEGLARWLCFLAPHIPLLVEILWDQGTASGSEEVNNP